MLSHYILNILPYSYTYILILQNPNLTIVDAMIGITFLMFNIIFLICPATLYCLHNNSKYHIDMKDFLFNYSKYLKMSWPLQNCITDHFYWYMEVIFAFWIHYFIREFFGGLLIFCDDNNYSLAVVYKLVEIMMFLDSVHLFCLGNELLFFVFYTNRWVFFLCWYLVILFDVTYIIYDYTKRY